MKAWLTQAPAEEDEERGARPGARGEGSSLLELVKVATISGRLSVKMQEGGRRRGEGRAGGGIRSGAGSVSVPESPFRSEQDPS